MAECHSIERASSLTRRGRPRRSNVITVKTWSVCHDRTFPCGTRIINYPLSAHYLNKRAAKKAYDRIRQTYPDAEFGCTRRFFNRLRAGDMERRAALLQEFRRN